MTAAWINKPIIDNNVSNTKTFNAVSLYLWSSYLAFTVQVYKYVINGLGQTQIGMFDNNQSVSYEDILHYSYWEIHEQLYLLLHYSMLFTIYSMFIHCQTIGL